ncbi:MAG TPA: hypothetical protein VNT57_05425 [Desulfobacteria bacterium]|nr:hypothetical protein [Desulfobacteria bacterium]
MNWKPKKKPPKYVCPKKYCIHWLEAGNSYAPRVFRDLEDALESVQWVSEESCGCSFGTCIRNEAEKGVHDWYEPNEPYLEKADLPWFYFISNPVKLKKDDRDIYDRYFDD